VVDVVDAELSAAETTDNGRGTATLEIPKPSLALSDIVALGSVGLRGPS
jgi:hypothetical protein